jgi:ATP-binding cassette subfamily B multidrug efflux pump
MIKKLLGSVREFKRATILAPVCVSLEVVMDVVIPLFMAMLIDKGINGNGGAGDMGYILKIGAALVACCLISLTFGVLSGQYAARAMSGFSRNLRKDMFTKVQSFSFANIDKFSTASLVTRLTTDVMSVQNAFMMIIRVAVRGPLMMIFSLLMAATINWKLSLIFLAAAPVLAGGLLLIASRVHPLFRKMFETMDRLNRVVQENLRGMRVVKSFVRQEHEVQKFKAESSGIFRLNARAERLLALNQPLMQFAMYFSVLLVSWLGAMMIVRARGAAGSMTQGDLFTLIQYAGQILMSLMMLSMIYVMLTISRASAGRIIEVLDEESDIVSPKNPVTYVADGSVEFENVGFSYSKDPENLCLTGVSFRVEPGQTVGILGGTGSSKSTLVQLIPRLYDATSGTVRVGGVDVRDYDIPALRDEVAMVLQKNELFAGSIYENLRWGNENATDAEVEHAASLAQADDFIRRMPEGYHTFIEQGGSNVSGGQKQRLTIARALLKKPKILILDDSTSAVDTRTDARIRKAFREEIPHTTKFIIAQRVASVEDADVILVLDGGKINGIGSHASLLETNEIYREVYESQKKGGGEDA